MLDQIDSDKKRSDNPVPLDFPLNRCNLTIKEKCGQCIHFKRMAYPKYRVPCIEKGIIEQSKPCKVFQADLSQIKCSNKEHVKNISKIMEEMSPNELRLLASLLNGEERTRRYNFKFKETVYFRAFGGDYISNYVKAKVLFADSEYVHIQGVDGCMATLYHRSVLRERQWMKKRAELLRNNQQKDPNLRKYKFAPSKKETEIKSMLDEVIPAFTNDTKTSQTLATQAPNKNTRIARLDQILVVR